jgi:nucleoredoxin
MKTRLAGLGMWMILATVSLLHGAGLPLETTVTTATKLEIVRDGRVSGTFGLTPGAKLDVITLDGPHVQVRYRSLAGRVLAAHTDLAGLAAAMTTAPVAPAATIAEPVAEELAPVAAAPVTRMARTLAGKLVRLEGKDLRPQPATALAGVKFYAFYYSASWCGPCRQFTPELLDAYGKIRSQYPEFEVVLVSADRSAGDMLGYMRSDKMTWPALRYEAIRSSGEIMRYGGDGIPCLVLVDGDGKVLSDSYRGGRYVGPDAVLDDTWKILRAYRQKNPRPRA